MLTHNIAGTAADVTFGFTYSPASQTLTQSRTNDSYAWTGAVPVTRNYTTKNSGDTKNSGKNSGDTILNCRLPWPITVAITVTVHLIPPPARITVTVTEFTRRAASPHKKLPM